MIQNKCSQNPYYSITILLPILLGFALNRSFNEILLVIKVVVLVRYKLIFLGCAISITSYFFYLFYMHLTIAFLGKLYYNNSNEIIIIDLEKIVKKK